MMKMKIGPGVGLDELVDEVANAMGIDKESLAFGDVEEVEDGTKVQLYIAERSRRTSSASSSSACASS